MSGNEARQEARTAATIAVTPSEAVLLHGDRFAKPDTILTTGETLLLADAKVSADELARAALVVAVLANERAGALRLEVRTSRHVFGLIRSRGMWADTLDAEPRWPAGSLESAVYDWRAQAGAKTVADLVYGVLEEDAGVPSKHALGLIKRGLAGRGLLDTEEVKRLKVITTTRLHPSQALRDADTDASAALAEELVRPWREDRPEEWAQLEKSVNRALSRRRERDTDHDWND